jgi:hypothetical protein
MRRKNRKQDTILIAIINKPHIHMAVMTINDKQTSIISYFRLRMTIKNMFQPVQSCIFVGLSFLRNCKVCSLSILIKIIKSGVLY